MPAFNARLRPKEIAGLPFSSVILLTAALVFLLFSLLLPLIFKLITVPAFCVSLFIAIRNIVLGEDLQWVDVMRQAKREERCLTSEVFEEEE